ncbi:hypothetical protein DEH18_00520 [Streptomyces sp. NHF165]|nr:hypothetical protein DEH18_00520 [Streptomyces sp. NHF165]
MKETGRAEPLRHARRHFGFPRISPDFSHLPRTPRDPPVPVRACVPGQPSPGPPPGDRRPGPGPGPG